MIATSLRSLCYASACLAVLLSTAEAQIGLKLSNSATNSPAVVIKNNQSLVPTTGITVEAWMTFDETTAKNFSTLLRHTVGQTNVGSTPTYNIRVESPAANRRLVFKVRTAGGVASAAYSFAVGELKNWTHVAGTYDGTAVRIFVNGVEKAKTPQTGFIADQGGDLTIGSGGRKNNSETWNGEIDEVRLWPYARTQAEIQSTMKLALASVPGLVSTWSLNFTPKDGSGQNDGTDYNSPTYAPNSLRLTSASFGSLAFGTATAGCTSAPSIGASGLPSAGGSSFALMCVNNTSAASIPTGPGFLWLGTARFPAAVPVLGINLWVNVASTGFLLTVVRDKNGLARVNLPIPSAIPPNTMLYSQMFFLESGCAKFLSATEGLAITTM